MRAKWTTILSVIALLVATSSPAFALVAKSGTLKDEQCVSWARPYVQAQWVGYASIKGPGRGYYLYYTATDWETQSVSGSTQGGYWRATATDYSGHIGALSDGGTFAYCSG